MNKTRTLLQSSVVLYFIIALEVLIMISPFAGLFYSVMNPVLIEAGKYKATRWLSAFYLPHMILPQDALLQFIRITGSFLFVLGVIIFLMCAVQIYTAKFRRRGAVVGGLYSVIRHPQYLALGIAGLGLAILWPRFLTLVLWVIMAFLYYFLAKDEERRMLGSGEEKYRRYMEKTGMFLPRGLEKLLAPSSLPGKAAFAVSFTAIVLGGAFLLRSYSVGHLTLWTNGRNVSAVAILPEDGFKMEHRMTGILALPEVKERIRDERNYLIYFMPREYIMQGMIADTGENWRLYERHHSLSMIADWIFHPFRHLREGHHAMHDGMHMHPQSQGDPGGGVIRRLVFLAIDRETKTPAGLFAINAVRVPEFMVDADIHNLRLLNMRDLPQGTGWGSVPTPMF